MKHFINDHSDVVFAFSMTVVTFLFGGWDKAFIAFCVCISLDVLTGVIKGLRFGEFTSRRMREGFATKVGYIITIILATALDRLLPDELPILRTICLYFYIFVEGSSIVENLAQMGVPIPKALVDRLEVINGKGEGRAVRGENGSFFSSETTETVQVTEKVVIKTEDSTD